MNVLELKACKEDIPDFRKQVNEHEDAVLALESTVRSLLKLSKASVELATGKAGRQEGFYSPPLSTTSVWSRNRCPN